MMEYRGRHYRTVWWEDGALKMIDQTLLPFTFTVAVSSSCRDTARHIRRMTVRGAPAIGAAGAYGMVQAFMEGKPEEGETALRATRPTARDLFAGIDRVKKAAGEASPRDRASAALAAAEEFAAHSAEECRLIGEQGAPLIGDGSTVLTHCNAGWLACVDWGTALAPVYRAHREGKRIFVLVDETRPRCQGGKLTAWELSGEGIPHAVIPDTAAGFYMRRGKVDMVITGADRIAFNGDTANKIGTLQVAVCAQRFGIPFYIAAPWATFDPECTSGSEIPIEERDPEEVTRMAGRDETGRLVSVRVCNPDSRAENPAFDVTPAELVTGYITPAGVITAADIPRVVPR